MKLYDVAVVIHIPVYAGDRDEAVTLARCNATEEIGAQSRQDWVFHAMECEVMPAAWAGETRPCASFAGRPFGWQPPTIERLLGIRLVPTPDGFDGPTFAKQNP